MKAVEAARAPAESDYRRKNLVSKCFNREGRFTGAVASSGRARLFEQNGVSKWGHLMYIL